MPKTRQAFWEKKFADNLVRDKRDQTALRELGWRVLVVWECEIKKGDGEVILEELARICAPSSCSAR